MNLPSYSRSSISLLLLGVDLSNPSRNPMTYHENHREPPRTTVPVSSQTDGWIASMVIGDTMNGTGLPAPRWLEDEWMPFAFTRAFPPISSTQSARELLCVSSYLKIPIVYLARQTWASNFTWLRGCLASWRTLLVARHIRRKLRDVCYYLRNMLSSLWLMHWLLMLSVAVCDKDVMRNGAKLGVAD
ncbi:hypothetical protein F4680DRAFT_400042 [Xylaria scruposa]|nr:hypothetical protein F4680DRAFT_400042 [Xylaria scruposa]